VSAKRKEGLAVAGREKWLCLGPTKAGIRVSPGWLTPVTAQQGRSATCQDRKTPACHLQALFEQSGRNVNEVKPDPSGAVYACECQYFTPDPPRSHIPAWYRQCPRVRPSSSPSCAPARQGRARSRFRVLVCEPKGSL